LAGLPVEINHAAAAFPKLSARGKAIATTKVHGSVPCNPAENRPQGRGFRHSDGAHSMLPFIDLYLRTDRGIYLRPRAMRVDTYC
jgi:hypothetical protein